MLLEGVVSTPGRPLPIVVETGWNSSELGGRCCRRNGDLPATAPGVPCCSRRMSYHLYRREQGSSVLVSFDNVRAALPSAVEPGLSPGSCEDVVQASVRYCWAARFSGSLHC